MKTIWIRMLFGLALVAGAAGCALTNPTNPYAGMAAPGLEQQYPGGASRSAATLPVEGPVTLDNAIRVARINNPELAATAHEVSAAEARGDIANGQRLPSLHAIAAYTSYLNDQRLIAPRGNGELGVFSRDIVAGDLVVSMPLFTGGRITSEIRAAELLRQSAEHHLARTREELVFNVSSVFYSILSQKKVIESLGFSRKTLEEHLKRVDDLIAVEKAAKVDRLRTEVRLADLDQRTVQEKNILAIQVRVLENLMGLKDSHPPLDVAGDLASDEAGPTPSLEEELSRAIGSRDDYLSARAELEAQAKSVDAARAAQWPTVSLQGAYGGRWAADASEHPSGTSRSDDVGVAGVVVDVPIFEGGRIEARIREERARLAATRERLRKLELQIRLDVETAFLNVASSRERVAATEKAIEQAKESLRIEREKYDLGKGAIIDVLDAQTALLDSQTNYYRALADYSTAHAQLRLVVGEKR